MGKKWSNLNIPGALHYVTGNVLNRLPIFTREQHCQSFIAALGELLHSWPAKLIAYVLMPDHFHLITNPKDGRIKEFTGALKSKTAQSIVKAAPSNFQVNADGSHEVRQQSFKAIPLWSAWMIWQKINYIHANPVKAKLVKSSKDYYWSSFGAFYLGSEQPLKIDHYWWWSDDSEKLSKAMKELGWYSYHKRRE